MTHLTQSRRVWADGTWSDVAIVRLPAKGLVFAEIDQVERQIKLAEVAYLRAVKARARGVDEPQIVAFARLEQDRAVEEVFPGLEVHTAGGEWLYSANSLLTYTLRVLLARGWLRFDGAGWQAVVPGDEPAWQDRAKAVLDLLASEERLYLGGMLGRRLSKPTDFSGFDVRRDLVAVDHLGFIREIVWRQRPHVAFNAAFFLLEHDDFYSYHSALGEAYNLYVRDGLIHRPPLYCRAAFYQGAGGRWRAGRLSLLDMTLTLPDGTRLVPEASSLPGLPFRLNPEGRAAEGGAVAIYTRALGLASRGRPLRQTPRHLPATAEHVEYAVVDTRIVSRKTGGGLEIPQNGLVLSFPPGRLPPGAIPDEGLPRAQYGFAREDLQGMQQAIQAGPLLLRGGRLALSSASLSDESFWPTPLGRHDPASIGLLPTDYPLDIDRTRAGRLGLGADAEGRVIVVAVPGTERGAGRPGLDSAGATLLELAELLAEAGAVEAINLDGGGSTQLFYEGGLCTTPGNRFGQPGLQFERPAPCIGVVG